MAIPDRVGERLDALLLGPLADLCDGRELVVVPTGALHAVPWAALPSCAGRPVSVAPSAALCMRAATDGPGAARCSWPGPACRTPRARSPRWRPGRAAHGVRHGTVAARAAPRRAVGLRVRAPRRAAR
ncbi:CHAT domain-containing protein [Pseudonocardia sp. GCM10023141]|uniref:CHAT domain-containing protein n=1 Tax=Pseudonocardia sp. GCM10023141 TaxID=3252653 RepID=UPI0036113A2A